MTPIVERERERPERLGAGGTRGQRRQNAETPRLGHYVVAVSGEMTRLAQAGA
jgi:hypothetical protein